MTKRWYELAMNKVSSCNFGTFLRQNDSTLFEIMFYDFWLKHYNDPEPELVPGECNWLTYDPISVAWYERALNYHSHSNLATQIRQLSPDLFEFMFYDFWLRHTPKQIRRAAVIIMKSYQGDPRVIKTRFASVCKKCYTSIPKGINVYYWPLDKAIYHLECGEADYRDFLAHAQDEEFYMQQYR
jgi:hypothetical protein